MSKTACPIVFKERAFTIYDQVRETMVHWKKYIRNRLETRVSCAFSEVLSLLLEADAVPSLRKRKLGEANAKLSYVQVLLEEAYKDKAISPGFWADLSYNLSILRQDISDYMVERFSKKNS